MTKAEEIEQDCMAKAEALKARLEQEVETWKRIVAEGTARLSEIREELRLLNDRHDPEADRARSAERCELEDLATACWTLSSSLADLGRLPEAVEAAQKAVHYSPVLNIARHSTKANNLVILGLYCQGWGRRELAVQAFQDALRLGFVDHTDAYWPHLGLARAFNQMACYEEAEAHALQAHEVDPLRSEPFVELGRSLTQRGAVVQAANAFLDAVKLNPWNLKALGYLKRLINETPGLEDALPHIRGHLQVAWDAALHAVAPFPDEELEAPSEEER